MSRPDLRLRPFCAGLLLVLALAAGVPLRAQQPVQSKAAGGRIKVERSDELPRHAYPVSTTATALVQDNKQFAALAQQLQADLESEQQTVRLYIAAMARLSNLRGDLCQRSAQNYFHRLDELERRTANWASGRSAEKANIQKRARMEIPHETLNTSQRPATPHHENGAQDCAQLLEEARADIDIVLKELGSQLGGLSEAESRRLAQVRQ